MLCLCYVDFFILLGGDLTGLMMSASLGIGMGGRTGGMTMTAHMGSIGQHMMKKLRIVVARVVVHMLVALTRLD